MNEFWDFIKYMLVVVVTWAAMLAPFIFLIDRYEAYTCSNFEEVTGKPSKWLFMDDCYVFDGDEWMLMDDYKNRQIAREGLADG